MTHEDSYLAWSDDHHPPQPLCCGLTIGSQITRSPGLHSRVSRKAIISIITIISQGHNKYLETESIINPTLSFSITITLHYYIACHGMVPTSELDISINSANLPNVFIYPFIVDAILHSQFRVSPKNCIKLR